MLVGLIHIDSPGQPQDFFGPQIRFQFFCNLLFSKIRISALTEQTGFGHHHGSLSIAVDRTTFQHKRPCVIPGVSLFLTKEGSKTIVFFP